MSAGSLSPLKLLNLWLGIKNMSQFKSYREAIRAPLPIRLSLSLFIGLFFWGGLIGMMYTSMNGLPALFPSIVFVIIVGTVAFLLLSLFYKVSIRISKKLMASSTEKEIILRISGVKKEGSSYIRFKNIKALEIRHYNVPGFASINPFHSRQGSEGEQIVVLPGFQGEGILLTYTYETFFSQKKKTRTILFPTNNAQQLFKILKDRINTTNETNN